MATTTITVRVDAEDKKRIEQFCKDVGMNLTTLVNVFFKAVLIQRKIPFEIAQPPLEKTAIKAENEHGE